MDSLQPLLAVALVLGLLGVALWLLRKRATFSLPRALAGRSERVLEVVERVPLSASHALHLVRVGDRSFLVSTSPSSCGLLTEIGK